MVTISPIYIILFILLLLIAIGLAYTMASIVNKSRNAVEELNYKLDHDPITGHTNWDWLWKQIDHMASDKELPYDFAHFDIKGFRLFNELYNHDVGDEVLKYVS